MAAMATETASVVRIPVEEFPSHLPTLEQELSEGALIELTRGEAVVAEVRARQSGAFPSVERVMPDFMGRLAEIYGDKVFPSGTGARLVREDRDGRG